MSATYVGSTSDIITLFPLDLDLLSLVTILLLYAALPIAMNNDDGKKWRASDSRQWRLFFRLDKVSCLIVVFLVLAALTSRCTSSAYPSAAAQQFATLRTGGPLMMSGVLFIMCFHLLYSRRVDVPPPAHQTAIMTKRQRRNAW